ncbi:hypothetical protein [Snuella sedimenti]|uniref:Lipocalin-like domain-containing protein n=1 Tax=Snuella sedimenti TaxID=2798802 RepID=A0A8J7LUJ8_9FLAO|nr:hypothetical protein [Snuella sedimenti]MBJ6369840.1 hypothetical protein [Snuella sedimenti]
MKPLLFLLCITLSFSCKNESKPVTEISETITPEETPTIEGAWELVSYLNYRSDGAVDTIKTSNTNKQVKMYSASKVMWTRLRVSDSLDWFGYGDYTVKDGLLTEVLDYGSKAMNNVIKEQKEFVFNIVLEKNKFSQIQVDDEGTPLYAENYIRIE